MEAQHEALIQSVLEGNRQLYNYFLQLDGDRVWSEVDLTMPQLKVLLLVVSLSGATMSQIARGVSMTLSTATGVADRLIAHDFVRRENDPVDRRLVWLFPTERAVDLVEQLTQVGRSRLDRVVRRLDVEELRVVARAQDLLTKVLVEMKQEASAANPAAGSSRLCPDQPTL